MLVGVLALVFASASFACSCGQWGNGKFLVKESAAAFIGFPAATSVAVDNVDGEVLQKTPFVVLRNFKVSRFTRTINIHSTFDTGGNCGANFTAMTGVFLVFAYNYNGKLITSTCSLSEVDSNRSIKALDEITSL